MTPELNEVAAQKWQWATSWHHGQYNCRIFETLRPRQKKRRIACGWGHLLADAIKMAYEAWKAAKFEPPEDCSVFHIQDIEPGEQENFRTVVVRGTPVGVDISVEGYGTMEMEPGHGGIVFLELQNDVLRMHVWKDIKQSDRSHSINLEGAREIWREAHT